VVRFWGRNAGLGFEGPLIAPNPWDTVKLGDMWLPGVCKVRAEPTHVYEQRKIQGHDGAALVMRGYLPGPIEVECLMWTEPQWEHFQEWLGRYWRMPLKQSPTAERAAAANVTDVTTTAAVDVVVDVDPKKASTLAKAKLTRERALDIVHPALQPLGIQRVVLTGLSLPEPGSAAASRVVGIKCLEYVPFSITRSVDSKPKGRANRPAEAPVPSVGAQTPENVAVSTASPGKTGGGP